MTKTRIQDINSIKNEINLVSKYNEKRLDGEPPEAYTFDEFRDYYSTKPVHVFRNSLSTETQRI